MNSDIQRRLVLITGKDPSFIGTGFVIHCDETFVYVVTCAHVIEDVGGSQGLQANQNSVDVIVSGEKQGIDLAVLRLEKHLLDVEPLSLSVSGQTGSRFVIFGAFSYGKRDTILFRDIKGQLGQAVSVGSTQYATRSLAWNLKIDEEYNLRPGYSGAPVIEETSESVIGVVTHLEGDGKRGLAISIEALSKIWSNIPENLFKQDLKSAPAALPSFLTDSVQSRVLKVDWGQAPDVASFYGRDAEIQQLIDLIITNRCRLIAILGLGGIGKTALATKVANAIMKEFDFVMWRSLKNAPGINDLVTEYIQFLSGHEEVFLAKDTESIINRLVYYLRNQRCLLILDNIEMILQEDQAGRYKEGYEAYGRLIQSVGESAHQSCLIITSREKPREFGYLEGNNLPIQCLEIHGLSTEVSRKILRGKGLFGSDDVWEKFVSNYSGNPLILNIVSEVVREIYDGNIAEFIEEGLPMSDDARDVVEGQFNRLSRLEQSIMYWLAIARESMSRDEIYENIVERVSKNDIIIALRSLRRRSLVEKSTGNFVLQNVIMEYLTDRFVDEACADIILKKNVIFSNYAIINSHTKQYVRDSQERIIIDPITKRLLLSFESEQELSEHLMSMLTRSKSSSHPEPGYAGCNTISILHHIGCNLEGYDFSHLNIRRAYLQNTNLKNVSFAFSDLSQSVFTEAFGSILAVRFNHKGNLLASGTANGEVLLWNILENKLLFARKEHTDWVPAIAFSRDGNLVASASNDQLIKIWDINTGECLNTLEGHGKTIRSIIFSDSVIVSGGDDQTIRTWDLDSGKCLKILKSHTRSVRSIDLSPDDKLLASASEDSTIKLWDMEKGELLSTFAGHEAPVTSLDFSPDGSIIISGSEDKTVRIWDINTQKETKVLYGHVNFIKSVAFSPDGSLIASGGNGKSVRIWSFETGATIRNLQNHSNWVRSVCFNHDGSILASGSDDQTVCLWDVSTGQCLKTLQGYTNPIWSISFSPKNNTLVSGSENGTIQLWDTEIGRSIISFRGHDNRIWSVAFSPDGQTVASASSDATVKIWDVPSGQAVKTFSGHIGRVWSVTFSPDGKTIASGGEDKTIILWNINTGRPILVLKGHTEPIRPIRFSPDGRTLASCSEDHTVRLWNVSTGDLISTLHGHKSWVRSVLFSPDGNVIASGSDDCTIRIWNPSTGECLRVLRGHRGPIRPLAFHPVQHQLLASGGVDQDIRLWNISIGETVKILKGGVSWVWSVAFSFDGLKLAAGGDNGLISVWETSEYTQERILRGDRPYENMNITGVLGLTDAQRYTLKLLGAIEESLEHKEHIH